MTNSHSAPSSIRDDSICESSLHPNKSSGDIVERLLDRSDHYLPDWADAAMKEAAAEIERLRLGACDGCGSTESIASLQPRGHLSCCPERKMLTASEWRTRVLTAESAVAAAWEEAAKIITPWTSPSTMRQRAGEMTAQEVRTVQAILSSILDAIRASAIRAAVSKKTAESGHSPSTHNSASE